MHLKIARSPYQNHHVWLSVCQCGTTQLPLGGLSSNMIFEDFLKICYRNSCFISLIRITCTLHEALCIYLWHLVELLLEWDVFQTKVARKIKTPILCSVNVFQKSRCLWDNVEKYGPDRQVTDGTACWITKARMLIMKTTKSNLIKTSESTGFPFTLIF